jgi:CRISPR-associated exonuclease Cas4
MSIDPGGQYYEDDLLPISALQHLTFCERRAALIFVDCIWADNAATAEGLRLHEKVDDEQTTEVRGNVRIARGVWLRSLKLGLSGRADVVEFVKHSEETDGHGPPGMSLRGVDGTWIPFPVEYKRGRSRHEQGYEIQLCAQAVCLEEMLNTEVLCGAIYYGQSRRRVDVTFDPDLRARTQKAAIRLREVLREGCSPQYEPGPKCRACSLEDECKPSILVHSSASKYLVGVIATVEKEARCGDS